jgi:hypothetical protein
MGGSVSVSAKSDLSGFGTGLISRLDRVLITRSGPTILHTTVLLMPSNPYKETRSKTGRALVGPSIDRSTVNQCLSITARHSGKYRCPMSNPRQSPRSQFAVGIWHHHVRGLVDLHTGRTFFVDISPHMYGIGVHPNPQACQARALRLMAALTGAENKWKRLSSFRPFCAKAEQTSFFLLEIKQNLGDGKKAIRNIGR